MAVSVSVFVCGITPYLSGVCQDAKINSLERGLRDMEEEVMMLKSNGLLSCEERQEDMKQMEVYRSHTKFMKNKVRPVPIGLNSVALGSDRSEFRSISICSIVVRVLIMFSS